MPKMVLTLQFALVVFFLPSTSANTPLALVFITTCAGGVFLSALMHLLMRIMQLGLCGGGGACCNCIF